jgi:hypothetical protein
MGPTPPNVNPPDQAMTDSFPTYLADVPASPGTSAIGSLDSLAEGQVLLPNFAEQRADGLWLNPEMIKDPISVRIFVDRVFSAGSCFVGLAYPELCKLLYPVTPAGAPLPVRDLAPVRLATEVRRIPAERQALYKNVKTVDGGERAEYVFEPVHIERIIEIPIYGEVDENGDYPVTGVERKTVSEPAELDRDEFIAMMWQRGIKAALDLPLIEAAMASRDVQRMAIAARIEPVSGVDATLSEETDALHRDDSPRILPDGKVDLRHFKNRFPQITASTRLMRKVSKHFGQCGLEISGASLEPPIPRDFSLADMAGPGTRIEATSEGEFIVADRDGFLNIDLQSHLISVSEKIINRDGISLRTTGDLSLAGDHYEEHGEVQERRNVEGKHMTFHADVFGRIDSSGGQVVLKANLAGGRIHDTDGQVTIEGRASQAIIEARSGSVQIGYAENCTIVAAKVVLQRALMCTIVADHIEIEDASACALAARQVQIAKSSARKDVETLIHMAVPDFTPLDKNRAESREAIVDLEQRKSKKQAELDTLAANAELKSYLSIQARVRNGGLKLTGPQEDQFKQLAQRLGKPLQHLRALHAEITTLGNEIKIEQDELVNLEQRRAAAAEGVSCVIGQVQDSTTVNSFAHAPGAPLHAAVATTELKTFLRDSKRTPQTIFRGSSGTVEWVFRLPQAE